MLALEWRLTLLTLCPAAVHHPGEAHGPEAAAAHARGMQLNASMNNTIAERFNVGGALVVKLFGKPRPRVATRSRTAPGASATSACRPRCTRRVLFVALGLVAAIGTAIVYFVGGNLAISGTIGVGTIAAFTVYVSQIYQPLTQLANARVDVLTALVSFERVFEVLDFPAADHRPPRRASTSSSRSAGSSSTTCGSATRRPRCRRSRRSRRDRRSRHRRAATGSSATSASPSPPGELVALVGPSGAGKTTSALLVPRIYDVSAGEVRVDGHDVRDYTLDSLRGAVGMVMQDPHLFHDSDPQQPALRAPRRHRRRAGRGVPRGAHLRHDRQRCPTATTPSSASAATACRAARSSASPSPACS